MGDIGELKKILNRTGKVIVAFSGGVDSSFLLKMAKDTLQDGDVLAVTAVSETYTGSELKQAKRFAKKLGVRHKIIHTNELKDKNFTKNPENRCYYCKKELFEELDRIKKEKCFNYVLDASNTDDIRDYRPGSRAKKEFGVRSPLIEAGFSKDEIRKFSRRLKLDTADMPSMACLASRFPYGEKINKKALRKIEAAEGFIKSQGVQQVRVRCHSNIARIEVEKQSIKRFVNSKFCDKITKRLKQLGFKYIALDLEGYRTGSLNEVLK
ncbi:MAG: ATP-dependent sacrificial sulfur transferase LarE [Candidatus Omnitrophota bacterium]|nr:ATP-dependent sacrificial sulfur transferase LarE [Candidatus Omnitrophota bacterium]